MKIIYRLYADSLAMPRADDGVGLHLTYPEQLRAQLHEKGVDATILNRARGGTTLGALGELFLADSGYFGTTTRGVAILQCGIVDCAPRPIPLWARRGLARLPGHIRAPIVKTLHRNRAQILRSGIQFRFTGPTQFRTRYAEIIGRASAECDHVYAISIAPTITGTEGHSPGLSESIRLYNSLIEHAVRVQPKPNITVIDVCDAITRSGRPTADFISPVDGHHLTAEGHRMYASLVSRAEVSRLADASAICSDEIR
ncbi:MAG: SGNH/GDSL hydrolase family protein [Gemmatimonadota bacterium]|nr:SGNH/GDSL hydrolase family protein [Gemmatimonadota bacterium]